MRQNGTANNKSYQLGAMLGITNSNNACAVPRETKCEHATPLVPVEQSAIETIPTLWNPPSHSNPELPCNSVNILPNQPPPPFFLFLPPYPKYIHTAYILYNNHGMHVLVTTTD